MKTMLKRNSWATGRGALVVLAMGALAVVGQATLTRAQPAKAPAAKAPVTAPAPGGRAGAVRIYNPGGTADVDLENGVRHMTRNVRIWQVGEDFVLYAEDATHYEADNTAVAKGNLRVESSDSTIIGDLLRADFNNKVLTLTGNVVIKSHGKDDGLKTADGKKTVRGEVLHKQSSMTCDRLDYDYETKQATLSGSIRMRQGENFGTCERVIFDEERNIARLLGNVRFTNGDRQTFSTPALTIWIDSNMIQAPNSTSITIPRKPAETKPTRQREDLGAPPVLPRDLIEGKDRKPPPALPPLGARTPAPGPDPADAPPPVREDAPVASPTASPAASPTTPAAASTAPAATPVAR